MKFAHATYPYVKYFAHDKAYDVKKIMWASTPRLLEPWMFQRL